MTIEGQGEQLENETMTLARRVAEPSIALGYMTCDRSAAKGEPPAIVLDLDAEHQARCPLTEHHQAVAAFSKSAARCRRADEPRFPHVIARREPCPT